MKTRSVKSIFLVMLVALSGLNLVGQNIHVAVDGSDETGDGTPENPYATMTVAAWFVHPGDTVFVHGGTYHNKNFGDGDIWKIENLEDIECNGSEDAWIVFMPFPGDSVLLEFDASRGVRIKYSSYVKFCGFDIKGMGDVITFEEVQAAWGLYKDSQGNVHDLAEEMGIDITDPALWGQVIDKPETINIQKPSYYNGIGLMNFQSHHIIFENNTVRWAPASGLRVQKSDHTLVKGNRIYNNTLRTTVGVGAITVAEAQVLPEGDTSTGVKIEILGNNVHHNENQIYSWAPSKSFVNFVIDEGSGIFMTRNNDTYAQGYIHVANNLSYLNGASGIVVHKTNRAIIEHNTVYDNGTTNGEDTKPGGIGFNETDEVTIRNNISWSKPAKFSLGKVGGTNTKLTIDSNLVFNDYGTEPVVKEVSSGYFEADPRFADVQAYDFRLDPASPAIDRGITNVLVSDDIVGFLRADGMPDLGAHEYDPLRVDDADFKHTDQFIMVYPNPFSERVRVFIATGDFGLIQLYSSYGVPIESRLTRLSPTEVELDPGHLPGGIYLLRVNEGVVKIVKE